MSNTSGPPQFRNLGASARVTAPRMGLRALAERVREHLLQGGYKGGDRYLSVREVAQRWQVSPVTAHRTLRALSQEGILEVREGAGTFVTERPDQVRQTLVQTVHVFTPSDPDMRERVTQLGLQTGIMDVLAQVSMQLHFLPAHREIDYVREVFEGAETRKCLGSFLFRVPRNVRLYVFQHRLPAVVIGHVESDIRLPSIDRNQRAIAQLVGRRLLDRGHRRIGLLMRDSWNPGDDQLLAAFQELSSAASLDGSGLQVRSMAQDPSLIRSTVAELLAGEHRPTALVCRTDPIAIHALETAQHLGLRVPDDVALIGIGAGAHPRLQDAPVPITTTSSADRELGQNAARLLLDVVKDDSTRSTVVELPSVLIERQSG